MQRTARRFHLAAAMVACLVIAAVGLLFWQLRSAQQAARTLLIDQVEQRAKQLAHTVASRIAVVVRSADFVLLEARREYRANQKELRAFAELLRKSFPEDPGLPMQLSIAGPDGVLTYSSRGLPGSIQISDREHFRAHLDGSDRLYTSEPVASDVSGIPSIQFSRPILRAGGFAGVAVISISTERLEELLASFQRVSGDEIGILNSEGVLLCLSRSAGIAEQVGMKPPEPLPFVHAGVPPSGAYRGASFHDGAERAYAWHRVGDTGLVALVGLDGTQALVPLEEHVRRTRASVSFLAGGLLALGAGTIALLLRMSHQQQAVAASETRFRRLTQLSSDWYWEQDDAFRFTVMSGSGLARIGIPADAYLGRTRWDLPVLNLTEADWARHRADLESHRPFRDFELLHAALEGGPRWLSVSGEPMFDEQGRFAGYRGVARDISERKRAERELRELSERMRVGQATAQMIVLEWDIANDRLDWSDSPERLRGPLPADGRYPLWKDQVHPDDRERFLAIRAWSIESLQGRVQEYRIVRTDGAVRWLHSHQAVFAGRDGKAARMLVALQDITERKTAENQLRMSEARLAEAQRIAQIGSWELDLQRNTLIWSNEVYRIFEIDRVRFGASYEAFLDLVHPDDRAAVDAAYKGSLATHKPYRIVHRLRMPDGRIKYVEERAETEFAAHGHPLISRGTVQDITERTRIEHALHESERRLAGVIETAMDAIITIDERQRILSFNPAAEQTFGYRAEEALGRPVGMLIPERLRGPHEAHIGRFGRSGETARQMGMSAEVVGLRRDGAQIALEAAIARVETDRGLSYSVMMRDITARKKAEQTVRDQARLLDLIFRHSLDNIVLLDRDFNFMRVSESYGRTCQRDIAEFVGRNHFEVYPSDFREEAEQVRAGKTIYERAARPFAFPDHPEWGVTYWDLGLVPILGEDGEIELFLFTLKDVSERVRAEALLRESASRLRRLSQRLRSVEERERRAMARELHDRIGQNLSTLNLELGMLGQQILAGNLGEASGQLADMRQVLKTTIGHVRDVMSELRPPALEEFGLLAALKDLAADFTRKTRLAAQVDGDPLDSRPLFATELSMYRIAQEALNNVAKHARATRVRLHLSSGARAIELAITDDGTGFDMSQPRYGNPTWGLATMRERAEEEGIEFAIESNPGQGTRVTLRVARDT